MLWNAFLQTRRNHRIGCQHLGENLSHNVNANAFLGLALFFRFLLRFVKLCLLLQQKCIKFCLLVVNLFGHCAFEKKFDKKCQSQFR